ncbi:DUF2085 domain-containing protein [Butyrivibrio sp. XBB1001]|uniref:DUF2085 domain-containing protein n=1 Tax=Butyrivibrio sp. XBB1001 TaxID=1280682 RepID=UPI00047B91D1|nr:DUF2085 domain-containing protein [Butyrivibrio sp. XBB1001]
MNKKDKVWIKLMDIGHVLGCHQMESRSFSIGGYQFPLCARCTGVLIGELLGIACIIGGLRISWIMILIFIAVMGIDWFIQYIELLMSNNYRRIVTGTVCGLAMTYAYFYLIIWVIRFAKTII